MQQILRALAVALAASGLASIVYAQPATPTAGKTCVNQYADAPGVTAIKLIRTGYEIKAGWPGGLWLQKKLDTYFCNTGRQLDDEMLCWTLNDPVKGGPCQ